MLISRRRDQRQLDEARLFVTLPRRVIDALRGFAKIALLGPEDIGHESLRVAIVKREPARLDLHHDTVARQEDMIRGWQSESVEQRNVGSNWFRHFQAFAVAAAED